MKLKQFLLGAALVAVQLSAGANTILNHSSALTDTNNRAHFDVATILFPALLADTLTVGNVSGGLFHDHSSVDYSRAEVEVFNGTSWINIFTSGDVGSSDMLLSSIFASPITFSEMSVSGVRLSSTAFVGNAFHFVSDSMTYTVSNDPVRGGTIPVPSGLALGGMALAMLWGARLKRRV